MHAVFCTSVGDCCSQPTKHLALPACYPKRPCVHSVAKSRHLQLRPHVRSRAAAAQHVAAAAAARAARSRSARQRAAQRQLRGIGLKADDAQR